MRASKKVMGAVLLTSSAALVLGAPSVHADSSADDNNGLLGGLNLLNGVQLNLPVTVGGAGVLGVGDGTAAVTTGNTAGGSSSNNGGGGSSSANNNNGLVGGLNVGNNLQANVPVTVCGVGALLARGTGDCTVAASNKGGGGSSSANGNNGLVGGANALNNAQLNVPVTVCGLAVLGDANCEATVGASNTGGGSGNGNGGGGSSSANGNNGLLGGLNLLNNLQANIPVTVCGLAVLGDASGTCVVETTNNTGDPDDNGDVAGEDKDQGSAVRGSTLPHTGAASLALIPFGLALVAGGVALRRRVGSEA